MKSIIRGVSFVTVCMTAVILPVFADMDITESVMLTADTDWTSLGTVNIADGVHVHLNGHNLSVSAFAGAGSIYSSMLPAGFTELEYVESTGTQYIDTGVNPTPEAKVEADVAYIGGEATAYEALLSSSVYDNTNADWARFYGVWVWPNGGNRWSVMFNGTAYTSSAAVANGERCQLVAQWSASARTLTVDDESMLNNTAFNNPAVTENTMYLPAWNSAGVLRNCGMFRIYALKIYNPQTTLRCNYIPAKRMSDGAVGLYDTVSGTFSPSATATSFVAGPEVASGGGELHLNVADGTFDNSTLAISNSVRVVKEGAGTYKSQKMQTYSGGTLVSEGRITFERSEVGSYCGFGQWGSEIVVVSNAQIVVDGNYQTLNGYNLTIEGDGPDGNGAIYGKATGGIYNSPFIGNRLSLTGDASIKVAGVDSFNLYNNGGAILTLALNGHTLTVDGTARCILNSIKVPDEGRIITGIVPGNNAADNCLYIYGSGIVAQSVDFTVPAGNSLGGESALVVSNMTFGGVWGNRTATVTALARYSPKPTATSWPYLTLGDTEHLSPTLDLSALPFVYNGTNLSFVAGSAVTVYVGTREIAIGDCLVAWSKLPDITTTFTLTADDWTADGREIALSVREDGLYVKTTASPAYATLDMVNDKWLFFSADGTAYPEEWTHGVTEDMQVHFASYAEYTAIKAKGVTPSTFVMTAFVIPEGIGEINVTEGMAFQYDEGIVIDVKGNSLKLPTDMMFGGKAFTVTSSVAGGELIIEVANGTASNMSMTLSGSLKVTKRGAGTFVSALAQTYTGGTDVEAGMVCPPDSPADDNYTYSGDTFTAFGTGAVNVLSGAVFDVRGNYAYTGVCLKGGMIVNTLRTMNQTVRPGVFVASLADVDDSYFKMDCSGQGKYDMIYGGPGLATDLGGKTLNITEYGNLSVRSAITNGTLKVVENNGWFIFHSEFDMRSTVFDCQGALWLNANVQLGEYIHRKDTPYMLGDATLSVHKRFCPIAQTYFFGCTMQDGSTLDLSQRETPFTTSCINHQSKVHSVAFAGSARITVNLSGRTDLMAIAKSESPYVAKWGLEQPEDVTFVLDQDTAALTFAIASDEIGLRLIYSGGTVIILR